ncbi:hypothetical protein OSTOST_17821 [Ostertagia ostertagi]
MITVESRIFMWASKMCGFQSHSSQDFRHRLSDIRCGLTILANSQRFSLRFTSTVCKLQVQ